MSAAHTPELVAALRNFVAFAEYHDLRKTFPRIETQLCEMRAALAKVQPMGARGACALCALGGTVVSFGACDFMDEVLTACERSGAPFTAPEGEEIGDWSSATVADASGHVAKLLMQRQQLLQALLHARTLVAAVNPPRCRAALAMYDAALARAHP